PDIDDRLGRREAMAVPKAENAAMLKKTSDDRFGPDVLRQPGNARPQAADSTDDEVDLNAGLAGPIERIDDARIDQRVHLHPDLGRPAGPGMLDLGVDPPHDLLAHRYRRDCHAVELHRLGIAGDVVEDLGNVLRDYRISSKEGQ